MSSCLIQIDRDFTLEGYGKNKAEAFNKAFSTLQAQAYASLQGSGLLLHMEPLAVEILEEHLQNTVEKVVGFFRPKPIMHYQVKFRVTVRLKYIPIDPESPTSPAQTET